MLMDILVIALAVLTFGYCAWKTTGDFRAGRWLQAWIGAVVTLAVAPLLAFAYLRLVFVT